jgi:SP family general alpha glucoside:H+ symporter-like MFS transporter
VGGHQEPSLGLFLGIHHVFHHRESRFPAFSVVQKADPHQVMESFDMFLNGNFVAQTHFQRTFGVKVDGAWVIPTKWQSALFQSGQCGAFVGVFLAGPVTNRLGYRWTTILALILMNATIFVSFFADSLALLVVGQALEGVPWGFFIANSPAYASEIVPLSLRGACTATLQMSWSIGSIIVAAATLGYNQRQDQWAWRVPLALQWIFPVSLSFHILCASELTRLDTSPNPRLPRPRISLVADSSRTQRGGPSLHQAPQ